MAVGKKTFIFISVLLLVLVGMKTHLFAQSENVLSSQAFLSEAVNHDPGFKGTLQIYLKSTYATLSKKAIHAWTLSGSVGFIHSETVVGSDVLAAVQPLTDTDTLNYSLGIQKLFYPTGTRLGLEHSNGLTDIDYTYGMMNQKLKESAPTVKVSVLQPLLKNAFGLAERFPLIQAELQEQAALLDAEEAWENRLIELYDIYLNWVAAHESMKALEDILQDLKKLEQQVARKVKAGVAERTDLLRTKDNVLSIETQLEQAKSSYYTETMNVMFSKSGKAITMTKEKWIPQSNQLLPSSMPEAETLLQSPVAQLRMLRKLGLLQKQLIETEKVAQNDSLPSLDLVGEVTMKGKSDDRSGGYDAISDKQDYTVMLKASYPIGNPKANGDIGQAQAGIEEIKQSMISTEQKLTLSKLQLAETIKRTSIVVELQKKQLRNAEEKLRLDTKNYKIGRLDTFYLIDAQNALTNARLQLVKTDIQLKRLKIQFLALNDDLLTLFPALKKQLNLQ